MYNLHVANGYHLGLELGGQGVKPGGTAEKKGLGNIILTVPGQGEVNFIDIGEKKITGVLKQTWGVLISYQGKECEFRYEGGGEIKALISEYGQVALEGNGSFILTDLPSFKIPGGG